MPRDRKAPGDYAVGYGKPPEHTRFKPGQSGNPKGRRKGSQDVDALLQTALAGKVNVNENGRSRKMSKLELMLNVNVTKAVKGDARSFREIMNQLERMGRSAPGAAASQGAEPVFGVEEMDVIARFMKRELEATEAAAPTRNEDEGTIEATTDDEEHTR